MSVELHIEHDLSDEAIARALEKCDWSGASIGNKAIVSLAISALRDARPVPETPALDVMTRFDLSIFGNGIVEMGGGEYVRHDQASRIIADKDARIKELDVEIAGLRNSYWQERKARLEAEAALKAAQERDALAIQKLEQEVILLQWAIVKYGDASRMAWAEPAALQQAIDRAQVAVKEAQERMALAMRGQ